MRLARRLSRPNHDATVTRDDKTTDLDELTRAGF
jgi:hypothetical protein